MLPDASDLRLFWRNSAALPGPAGAAVHNSA
jgi:hypothetical protein